MADNMIIPTRYGDTTTVSVKVAQRYYVLYKHHLTHNHSLSDAERAYLDLYTKYFEKVSEAEYV
jgi:hypothetical protein